MLSILIPTYNFDCSAFVHELATQADALGVAYEIIVCDDGSPDEKSKVGNRVINNWPHCRFVELARNGGLARNRNHLGTLARYDYLLFLDSDLMPCDDRFVARYVQAARPDTVIGGTIKFRVPGCSEADAMSNLRYVYARAREERTAKERNRTPHAHFSGFSCLIPRGVFERIRFCDTLTSYGYEDTLFGKELEAAGISMRYIDNPVFHDITDSSATFLQKTETGLRNALLHRQRMEGHVRILDIQQRLKRAGLQPAVRLFFALCGKSLRRNLLGRHPRLRFFDLYKLGYLARLDHRLSSGKAI